MADSGNLTIVVNNAKVAREVMNLLFREYDPESGKYLFLLEFKDGANSNVGVSELQRVTFENGGAEFVFNTLGYPSIGYYLRHRGIDFIYHYEYGDWMNAGSAYTNDSKGDRFRCGLDVMFANDNVWHTVELPVGSTDEDIDALLTKTAKERHDEIVMHYALRYLAADKFFALNEGVKSHVEAQLDSICRDLGLK